MIEDVCHKLNQYKDCIDIMEEPEGVTVRPTRFLNREKEFLPINEIVRELGGKYNPDPTDRRWVIPNKQTQKQQGNPALKHLAIIRSELDKLEESLKKEAS